MKRRIASLPLIFKTVRQLGLAQSGWYVVYQLGLRSGHYRRAMPVADYPRLPIRIHSPFHCPTPDRLVELKSEQAGDLIREADEISAGHVRLFGGPPVPLELHPPGTIAALRHWTAYEGVPSRWGIEDIKLVWEPARFGWVYPLGRGYCLSGDERYPSAFWAYFETFLAANPLNQGPNWSSAQEVALRLLALIFAAGVFAGSLHSTAERMARLAGALAAHAGRIPPTLAYARAQNNNHQISEALGLYAAGHALADHPLAQHWRTLGWKELNQALVNQIAPDGTYAQHSMNYHRLMLCAVLNATSYGQPFPALTTERLAAAARWLLSQIDPLSGQTPNLGNNDGAHILPLASADRRDYRPVGQAAARAFLGQPVFPPGPWDEMGEWLGQAMLELPAPPDLTALMPESPAVARLGDSRSWATLRAVHFNSRPAQADQLHVDLWWRGENIALDAGTFRYSAPAPWDNPLAETRCHNTIEVDGLDQMLRAGRFRWLDWAQASRVDTTDPTDRAITVEQDGYRRLGVLHRRTLKWIDPARWQVTDQLLPISGRNTARAHSLRLHWLLPDWPWSLEGSHLTLNRPGGGRVHLSLNWSEGEEGSAVLSLDVTSADAAVTNDISKTQPAAIITLARAGTRLAGTGLVLPTMGWFSPTYNVKFPALSFALSINPVVLPTSINSDWWLEG